MDWTSNSIGVKLNSLINFEDRELANLILNTIFSFGKELMPKLFFCNSDQQKKVNYDNLDEIIDMWLNSEKNKTLEGYSEGNVVLGGKYISYMVHWHKGNQAAFNFLVVSVDFKYFKGKSEFDNFFKLCNELILLVKPVHGEIANESFPEANVPLNLTKRIPEIQWMKIFGKPYIDMFGRDKLLSTPCFKVESLAEDIITVQSIENIFEQVPDEVKGNVKNHLGKDAFVWGNKPIRAYKDGVVPIFNFSEVLFDKTKPIEEPQIIKRKN